MGTFTTEDERLARDTAFDLLKPYRPRLQHTVGVVNRVRIAAVTVDAADVSLLIAAAWLHDIGYVNTIRRTGFHPLDGALYLQRTGWPSRLCGLVAFHSGAHFVAAELGLNNMLDQFIDERGPVQDALTYADQTTGPTGDPVTYERRVQGMLKRHGPDSPNARAHPLREPHLRAAVERVMLRLDGADTYPGRHRRD